MTDESDCPVCQGERPVTWLITHLNPAATIRSCEEDFEAAVLALLGNRLEVDAGWLSEVINNAVDEVNAMQEVGDTPYEQPAPEPEPAPESAAAVDDRELRDLTPEKFARKYGTDDDDQAAGDE